MRIFFVLLMSLSLPAMAEKGGLPCSKSSSAQAKILANGTTPQNCAIEDLSEMDMMELS